MRTHCTRLFALFTVACAAEQDPAAIIPPLSNPGAVYDAARREALVFGGEGGRRQLWSWNGTRWALRAQDGPSGRDDAVMVFDAARGRVLLFGGRSGAGPSAVALADTWEWDGQTWTRRNVPGPGPRTHSVAAYDAVRNVVVLSGGVAPDDSELRDTWEWNGTSWARVDSLGPIGPRNGMAFDVARGRLQMLVSDMAASAGSHRYASALWEFDGAHWVARGGSPPPLSPVQRLVSAGSSGGLWLFDGNASAGAQGALWRWDNQSWVQQAGPGPASRNSAAVVYDHHRNVVVLVGGWNASGELADTWEWNGTQWSERTP